MKLGCTRLWILVPKRSKTSSNWPKLGGGRRQNNEILSGCINKVLLSD